MVSMSDIQKRFGVLFDEIGKVIVGQDEMVEQMIVAMLCDSHALLEGYPGLAKTLAVKTVAETFDLRFSRIQGTPDLLPADITGTYFIDETKGKKEFKFQPGPIFANIVLMDEINRATPKTQAALLEAMQEKQVTSGNTTFKLDEPFFVLATQNPIEQEGTFKLPEAQSDRFLFKIKVGYPSLADELEVVNRFSEGKFNYQVKKIFNGSTLSGLQGLVRQVPISNDMKKYAVDIVNRTRAKEKLIEYGASPRASIGLILASKARALVSGRKYVSREDINAMSYPILRHRIILSFDAEKQNFSEDDVVKSLLK